MNWDKLIDEQSLRSVLPGYSLEIARTVKEGLNVFLCGLPETIQQSVLAAQMKLPITAAVSERLGSLGNSCPVLQKLGQVLARNQQLAPELREQLQKLESMPSTVPLETIRELLTQELGPLDRRGIVLMPPAIAEASVAVVIAFQETRDGQVREGVFKILKPGIEERLEIELELLGEVGTHLDARCDDLKIPEINYRETFDQIRQKLSCEVLLDQEQHNLVAARDFYSADPEVLIPELFDCCTSRVTAMQRVVGGKITDHDLSSRGDRSRLATMVARALISRPMLSRASSALFHSDPHAGNLLYTEDGRLAILDWCLVGSLSEQSRVSMAQIILGAITLRSEKIVGLLEELSDWGQVDRLQLSKVVGEWLQKVRYGQYPGLSWVVGLVDDAIQSAQLRVAGDLMLFRKSLLTLEGVIGDLGADGFCLDDLVSSEFLRQFGRELPERWFSTPASNNFATRLSNLDLVETALSYPLTLPRFWLAEAEAIFEGNGPPGAATH